jgi:hypothetical protein
MIEQNELQQLITVVKELAKRVEAIEARGGGSSKRTVWELTQIIEAKQKKNDELKRAFTIEVAMGTQWQMEEARLEYVKRRKEISELNEQLAGM